MTWSVSERLSGATYLKVRVQYVGLEASLYTALALAVSGGQEELDVSRVEGVLVDVLKLVHTVGGSH